MRVLLILLLLTSPALALEPHKYPRHPFPGSWLLVGHGGDEFNQCSFTCKIRVRKSDERLDKRPCRFTINGKDYVADMTGSARRGTRNLWRKYAAVHLDLYAVFRHDGSVVEFNELGLAQFAYDEIRNNIAFGTFRHGASRWEASNGMTGSWTWQWSSDGGTRQ